MPIPDPDPLTPEDWATIEETLQEAAARAHDAAGEQKPGGMHRLLLAQAAQLEAVLGRVRDGRGATGAMTG